MANATFDKKKNPFSGQLHLNLREKPVQCCVWSRNCCSAENWTLWKVSEMWSWRRTEKIVGTGRVKNGVMYNSQGGMGSPT